MQPLSVQAALHAWQARPFKAATAGQCLCGTSLASLVHERVMADMSRRKFIGGTAAMLAPFAMGKSAMGQGTSDQTAKQRPLLLTNLRLFDGIQTKLSTGLQVLIEGQTVSAVLRAGETVADAQVIDCQGKVLMPGLIDVHWHTMLAGIAQVQAMTSDIGYLYLVAAREAQRTLMRGFTSVRDPGGPSFALKQAIDQGIADGPRIFPSGAMISQTSGHGDFRMRSDIPRAANAPLTLVEREGVAVIADGSVEVLRRVREQLMLGASQIKMMAGGGVASSFDPLDSTQYTEAELRAGVDAASDWNTYVTVHVYTPKGIQRSIKAGVRCIEHGQLADEASVRMMRDEGVWWSLQPFLQDEDSNFYTNPDQVAAQTLVAQGTVRAYEMAQKYKVKTGWGTDVLFAPQKTHTQGRQLAKMTRFYDPLVALQQATGHNGELLALSGERNPYPKALGVIQAGAWADMLLVDGDPSKSLDFLAQPDENLRVIMKGGKLYKNTL